MILVLDTETTGLAANLAAPATDFANWPRLVEIALVLLNKHGEIEFEDHHIIKPDGFTIPEQATAIHGISQNEAMASGVPIRQALHQLSLLIKMAEFTIAHNAVFDIGVLGAEFLRAKMYNYTEFNRLICTQQSTIDFCAIPNTTDPNYVYKRPTLKQLNEKLHGQNAVELYHFALTDSRITAKCYNTLISQGYKFPFGENGKVSNQQIFK